MLKMIMHFVKQFVFGHFDIVKLLVENGANIHVNNNEALHLAVKNGHFEIVNFLKFIIRVKKIKKKF